MAAAKQRNIALIIEISWPQKLHPNGAETEKGTWSLAAPPDVTT
jgi:hypothetical protein